MSDPAHPVISLRNVAKHYALWHQPSDRLMASWKRFWHATNEAERPAAGTDGAHRFTALSGLSFDVLPGECLGIIGRNGAGKSTLLQLIAGTLQPSEGEIQIRGRVAALLELGSGFNPDFTGRENVRLNASILGLTREEIDKKYDSIVAYAGIEEFMDRPVRTYSSGMAVRLAFAVCVHVDADILLVDEALAVGDARFQFKCHATIEQMREEKRTIIVASHDTNALKRICNSAMLLERGQTLVQGTPNEVVNIYSKMITSPLGAQAIRDDVEAARKKPVGSVEPGAHRQELDGPGARSEARGPTATPAFAGGNGPAAGSPAGSAGENASSERFLAEERQHRQVSDKEYAYGGKTGRITEVSLQDATGHDRLSFVAGSGIRVRLRCVAHAEIHDPIYAVTIKDVRGQEIFGTNTWFQNLKPPSVAPGREVEAVFDLQLNVQPGVYFLSAGWVRVVDGEVQVIHRRYDAIRFDVLPRDNSFGVAWCPTTISVRCDPPAAASP